MNMILDLGIALFIIVVIFVAVSCLNIWGMKLLIDLAKKRGPLTGYIGRLLQINERDIEDFNPVRFAAIIAGSAVVVLLLAFVGKALLQLN